MAGEQVGGQDRGDWYYRHLAIHIVNYAQGVYEGFDGETNFELNAVDLTTVHRAKGLEWPAVMVPSMTANRFPTARTGRPQPWLVPRDRFAATRHEGSDLDERRLSDLALTRARDWLSVSRHDRVTTKQVRASRYFHELQTPRSTPPKSSCLPSRAPLSDQAIEATFSEVAAFFDCAMAYRLRNLVGFQPRLAPS